jgi:HEAT repeat protein
MRTGGWICLVLGLAAAPVRAEPTDADFPLSVWIGLLEDPRPYMRLEAANAMASFGSEAVRAVPVLIRLLSDAEPDIVSAACTALAAIGSEGLPDLRQALRDPLPSRRLGAARALGKLPGPVRNPALRQALADSQAEVRLAAAEGLLDRREDRPAVLACLLELLEKQAGQRLEAARLLGRLGPEAAGAVPQLRKMLHKSPARKPGDFDPAPGVAADALRRIGPAAQAALPELRARLADPDTQQASERLAYQQLDQRVRVAAALLALGAEPALVYPPLVERGSCRDWVSVPHREGACFRDEAQRRALAMVLTGRQPPDDEDGLNAVLRLRWPLDPRLLPVLMRALNNPKDEVRATAGRMLGRFEELPVKVVAQLRQLADEDVDTVVRRWSAIALCRLPGALRPADVEDLLASLTEKEEPAGGWHLGYDWQAAVIPALAEGAATTLPYLITAMKSSADDAIRSVAAETLALLALANPEVLRPALPALKEAAQLDAGVNDPPESPRTTAAWAAVALARLEVDTRALQKILIQLSPERRYLPPSRWGHRYPTLTELEPRVVAPQRLRRALKEVFARLGDEVVLALLARETFPDLAELIHSGRAPGAVPALLRDLGHAQEEVRRRAATAFTYLREDALRPALPALLRALEDRCLLVRLQAAVALAETALYRDRARAVLLELLIEHHLEEGEVAQTLCRIGVPAAQAPSLLRLMTRGFRAPRRVYFRAAPDALAPLGAMLDHPERGIWAGSVLHDLGPAGQAVLGRALNQAGPRGRRLAVDMLRQCDSVPVSAVAALRQALTDPDPEIAGLAAVALACLGHGDATVIAVLLRLVALGDLEMRPLAIEALGRLGKQGRDGLPALRRCCIHEPDHDICLKAIAAVGQITACFPEEQPETARVLATLLDENQEVCLAAVVALAALDFQKIKTLIQEPLADVLDREDVEICARVVSLLRKGKADLLPHVVRLLKSPDVEKRKLGINSLASIPGDRARLLPLLHQGLSDASAEVRERTYATLCFRHDASVAVPFLLERLECERTERRIQLLKALAMIGTPARAAMPALVSQLRHPDGTVRLAALRAVLNVADGTVLEAHPAFTDLLKDREPEVRRLSVLCLASSSQPLPGLLHALDDAESAVQSEALRSLARLPRLPAEALPPLLARLKDASSVTRCGATRALARLGERGGPAVSALTAALYDTSADVRAAAAQSLGALGPLARAAEAELKALRRDRHEPVRRAAAEALAKLQSEAR